MRSTSTLKSRRSRLLMPIRSARPRRAPARSSARVVDLDEHVEAELAGLARAASAACAVVERGDDQQHRVGAGGARLVQLVGVDDEVLAQHRQRAGGAGGAQVLERAVEVGLLGEHETRRRRRRARRRATSSAHDRRRSRSDPAEGERRLNSAITARPGAASAARKACAKGWAARRRFSTSAPTRAAARACARSRARTWRATSGRARRWRSRGRSGGRVSPSWPCTIALKRRARRRRASIAARARLDALGEVAARARRRRSRRRR